MSLAVTSDVRVARRSGSEASASLVNPSLAGRWRSDTRKLEADLLVGNVQAAAILSTQRKPISFEVISKHVTGHVVHIGRRRRTI